ncbi:RrF2 family transcriptional regulator [Hippea maritima]|uniref:Transcriptional regulator, BadM/Rrf2 family n=1 Tax=Hippea maritima (strain ATCC 700847 / DSM 10411 / MH2) TaxID=760142 RepID=F2LTN8_HIPMA|nr:Rrf2 family transcriptional regulator [Hippea maritima]AEA33363.1 transcriptional regulator, BadM/Rrf2 family [Hippea maritima DSM 10411]
MKKSPFDKISSPMYDLPMKFPTKVRYSLRLLIEIKNSNKPITLREVSEKTHISENYLKQLAAKLEKEKVIKGKKGPNGGYTILNPDFTLKELIDIFTGGVKLAPCMDDDYRCELMDICKARDIWSQLNKDIDKLFLSVKLKDF